jgi:hypothetical protein
MSRTLCTAIAALLLLVSVSPGRSANAPTSKFPLDSVDGLETTGGKAEVATYRERKAVKLVPANDHQGSDDSMLSILTATDFKDGVIEVEIAGSPRPGTPEDSRGFIGIAFRVQPHGSRYECFYIRPTNSRADDQLRRNHSTQYVSEPDYPWDRLRKENPGVYESYVDLESGAWTKIKIVVAGTQARLYLNGADQPALVVNDLKLGETHGRVALWAHWTTDAYFSDLTIK